MPLAIALIIVAAVLAIALIGLIWAMVFLLPFCGGRHHNLSGVAEYNRRSCPRQYSGKPSGKGRLTSKKRGLGVNLWKARIRTVRTRDKFCPKNVFFPGRLASSRFSDW